MCRCLHKTSSHQPSSHQPSPSQPSPQVDMWVPPRQEELGVAVPGVPLPPTLLGLLLGCPEIHDVFLQNLVIW